MAAMENRRVEDYLEAIHDIIVEGKHARTNDISKKLKIKPASVTEMLQTLNGKGLVFYKKYGGVTLTKRGERIAKDVKRRHIVLKKLLQFTQVPKHIAERDACVMEHSLSAKTIKQLIKFIEFFESCPSKNPGWMANFKKYCKTGKHPKCRKINVG